MATIIYTNSKGTIKYDYIRNNILFATTMSKKHLFYNRLLTAKLPLV
jgi:hypothetical protein